MSTEYYKKSNLWKNVNYLNLTTSCPGILLDFSFINENE